MRVVRKLWRGGYALPVAVWGFYCGGLVICILISLLIFVAGRSVFYAGLTVDPSPVVLGRGIRRRMAERRSPWQIDDAQLRPITFRCAVQKEQQNSPDTAGSTTSLSSRFM
jgi:hypothetical protein